MLGRNAEKATSVVALTILDGTTLSSDLSVHDGTKILIGVRSEEANLTHPLVVSTPTQRIPPSILTEICNRGSKVEIDRNLNLNFPEQLLQAYLFDHPMIDSRHANCHDPLIYSVESLLSRKLGLGDALERDQIHFRAQPVSLLVGKVLYDNLETDEAEKHQLSRDQIRSHSDEVVIENEKYFQEYHAMCSIKVILSDPTAIPKATPSYSSLHWIDVRQFLDVAKSRELGQLAHVLGNQAVGYCVHGLCIASSFVYLSALNLGLTPPTLNNGSNGS